MLEEFNIKDAAALGEWCKREHVSMPNEADVKKLFAVARFQRMVDDVGPLPSGMLVTADIPRRKKLRSGLVKSDDRANESGEPVGVDVGEAAKPRDPS